MITIVPAILLAILAAGCFAAGAVIQHRAVGQTLDLGTDSTAARFGVRTVLDLLHRPRWLAGLLITGIGATLHVVALILAPISVVQPIGVLAVPIAVAVAAIRSRNRPTSAVLVSVVVSVVGIGGFVVLAADQATSSHPEQPAILFAGLVGTGAIAGLALIAQRGRLRWLRCVSSAAAAAVAFGFVSALLRAIAQQVESGDAVLEPGLLIMAGALIAALAAGGYLVQQAFACGSPEVVVGSLTVVDPLVAVVLGFVLLGEGGGLDRASALAMAGCALLAAAGAISLARHHPDATQGGAAGNAAAAAAFSPSRPRRPVNSSHISNRTSLDSESLIERNSREGHAWL